MREDEASQVVSAWYGCPAVRSPQRRAARALEAIAIRDPCLAGDAEAALRAVAERLAFGGEGATDLIHRFRSHTVQLQDIGLAEPGKLLKPQVPGPSERSSRRFG